MRYEFHVLLKYDPEYFVQSSGGDAANELNQYGENGWRIAGVTRLADDRGYAIILQRPIE